ncbi:hypothetical protein P3L10_032863 [Capsicum annuum]
MVHLVTHLATEAKLAGPVNYRWMYPIERYLGTLKLYVRNHVCPEGSIARKCDDKIHQETSKEKCLFSNTEESYGREDVFEMDEKTLLQVQRHVLFNCDSEVVENYKK